MHINYSLCNLPSIKIQLFNDSKEEFVNKIRAKLKTNSQKGNKMFLVGPVFGGKVGA